MRAWSLRSKIVVMASLVVAAACLFLTATSIAYAGRYMRSMVAYDHSVEVPPPGQGGSPGQAPDIPQNRVNYQNTIRGFSISATLSMVFTVMVLAAAIFLLTGKILKPLSRLTHSISSIDDKNLRHRVELPRQQDEVYRLTQSFNNMMDRLEGAYIAQKNFAANAAHELKTPLSIMKTSLQVLELQGAPSREDYMEFTDDVRQGMDRLIKTVESLLTLTSPSLKGDTETINALAAAERVKNDLAPLAEAMGVAITVKGDALQVTYNNELFYRAVFNLVENAVKYNNSGGYVHITVSGGERLIRIEDNGIGMDAQAIENVFEPFYRSDLSRSQKIPGSGLGMSIVKTVIDRYGGTLEIDSALGKGTTVQFKI